MDPEIPACLKFFYPLLHLPFRMMFILCLAVMKSKHRLSVLLSCRIQIRFVNLSAGVSPDNVNVIALCRGDLNQSQCNSCLNYTATELERLCPSNKEATAWSELCLVRYANRNMYGMLENDPRTCAYNEANASNPDQFNQTLNELLNDLSSKAAAGGPLRKYAASNATAGNLQTVYATVQCTPDLDEKNCTTCLNYAMGELQNCCYGRIGCRVLRPNCLLRFETNYPFYNQITVPLPSPSPTPPPSPTTSSSPNSIGAPPSPTTSCSPTSIGGKGSGLSAERCHSLSLKINAKNNKILTI
ncbi:cysteine-rich repeat secretory protein 38-like [Durio zibethinus]|uniref:Cysteine-rich repeat secretory protein 38-like n=1 Tax=Durio zibethinus TaxID=66656 RepID=A0A6P5WZ72_DURZI|nr:cysteine-rich repeat secretory protein 38-like [Durio zibethinus]